MVFSTHFKVAPLTDPECDLLSEKLGTPINAAARHRIDVATNVMFASVVSSRLPNWKIIRTRLREIIRISERLFKESNKLRAMLHIYDPMFAPPVDHDPPFSDHPVDLLLRMYLSDALSNTSVEVEVGLLHLKCKQGLMEIAPEASKRGQKRRSGTSNLSKGAV
jgi:hypothetical protein